MALKAIAKALTRSEELVKDRAKFDRIRITKLRIAHCTHCGQLTGFAPETVIRRAESSRVEGNPVSQEQVPERGAAISEAGPVARSII